MRLTSSGCVAVLLLASACSPDAGSGGSAIDVDASARGGGSGTGGSSGSGTEAGAVFQLSDASAGGGGTSCDACADAGPACGDGILDGNEACDDGNTISGDGCVGTCTAIENDFACPNPGAACVSTVQCGDGKTGGAETCDDGNVAPNDGCGADCAVETGWQCPVVGAKCVAAMCGDGIIAGTEQCDDGSGAGDGGASDGCDATCHVESGWACDAPGTPCHRTTCGDGKAEGTEQCDDGNLVPYDGCSPTCTQDPKCNGGTCSAVCGDGFKFPQEDCDDGNRTSGDGCSATCMKESGFACQTVTLAPPAQLQIPILYRDFLYHGTTTPGLGHPDFEWHNGAATGLVQANLGADGIPVLASTTGSGTTQLITDAQSFYWWYHEQQCDTATPPVCTQNPYEKLVYQDAAGNPTTLTLSQQADGSYQFSNGSFFPVDGLGWGPVQPFQLYNGHNFSFSSELRYPFTYKGGEVLSFSGDDDVWVFINGKLAVDIGGVHGKTSGAITLDATAAANLGLTVGGMYEIALFQAERHTTASNYFLTLSGFEHSITQCQSVCGDGIVTPDEACDDGVNNGGYGSCTPDCKGRGPYCGDGILQDPPETCDDGVNLSPYGGCAPGCVPGGFCGDGKVDSRFGEQCDDGNSNNRDNCTNACKRATPQ